MMRVDSKDLFHSLVKASFVSQTDRNWIVSGLVRVEHRSVYIRMHVTGAVQEAASSAASSMYFTLKAVVMQKQRGRRSQG